MRILLTGSNGLLGQKLIQTFSTETCDLIGCDLAPESFVKNISHEYFTLDLTERKSVSEKIRSINPDVIIHTAAMTGVDACELNKEKCWQINVTATDQVVRAAEKVKSRFIFISSDYVFDGEKGPYNEQDNPNPINYYGRSKLAAENLVRGSTATWTIVRTVVLYGVGFNIKSSFVTWLLEELRAGRSVYIVDDQWSNTTLVDDLAKGIERIVLLEKDGLYHIGGSEFMTRFEFARRIAKFFNLDKNLVQPVSTEELRQPAQRPLRSGLEIEKAERDFFMSFHDVSESLKIYSEMESIS